MPIQENQIASFHYRVENGEGKLIDQSEKDQPLSFLSQSEAILPKLEAELSQMEIGEKRELTLQPEDAYGTHKPELIQQMSRSQFPPDATVEPGAQYTARDQNGRHFPFVISKVDGDDVTIDYNHPMAGETLTFNVELVGVRDASEEEIAHGHAHDGHHHHHDHECTNCGKH
jgi:FKBP-type peptidyl-prolyl cis-trans isomerase SlyD